MKPTLFELFGEPVPSYFAMLLLGFGLAIAVGTRWAKRAGYDHETMIDLGLYALIWGVIGARILHVLADGYLMDYVHLCTDPSQVGWPSTAAQCFARGGLWDSAAQLCRPAERDCFAWAKFWQGGLTYYGGLIAAGIFCVYFLKKEGFPVLKGVDVAGMTIPLGLFFGRLGCFLGGCCFGHVVGDDHPLGIRFPGGSAASEAQWLDGLLDQPYFQSLAVHPTQLYESLGCLLITAVLMLLVQPRKRFDGQVMLVFLLLYAALRFALELLRADARGELLGLSTSQAVSVGAVLLVVPLWRSWRQRARQAIASRELPAPPSEAASAA